MKRFEGCLVGLAVGDALGFPTEFRRREAIVASFPPDGVTGFVGIQDPRWPARPMIVGRAHPPGTCSDDTQMTLALAEGLLAAATDDVDTVMEAVARAFVAWSVSPENDRAPGSTCMSACERLHRGVPWREAGVAGSKGCGAPMRVAPVGLRWHRDRRLLVEMARASSMITHGHPAAIASTAGMALAVALALDGVPPDGIHAEITRSCAPESPDLARLLARVPSVLARPPGEVLVDGVLGEGWVADEALAGALYCFWRTPHDFRATVLAAANTDGDSDSLACMAGAISGACNGVDAIPAEWARDVENAALLRRTAARLHAAAA